MQELAIVVLSGGLDSATALGIAIDRHAADNTKAITFEYGQKHASEVSSAQNLCDYYGVDQAIIPLSPSIFRGGVLTTDAEIPDMRYDDLPEGEMSPTYVPFRNGNLLAMAAAYADSTIRETMTPGSTGPDPYPPEPQWESALIYAGMHAEDAAGFAYADCTPEFLGAMAAAIHVGTYGRVRLQALFQFTTKDDIIREGVKLNVPYGLTLSCYKGQVPACGKCSTCHARQEAFAKAGFVDPIEYAEVPHGA